MSCFGLMKENMELSHIHLAVQKNNIICMMDELGYKRFDEKSFAQHFPK